MRRFLKWVVLTFLLLVVIVSAGGGIGYLVIKRGVTPEGGQLAVEGISAKTTITRDENGVPHIKAESLNDAMVALGIVHAQDRLWQMEVLRRASEGRLSELFGKPTLSTDILTRTLDIAGYARRSYANLDPKDKEVFKAYASGVNQWITRKHTFLTPDLPPEYLLTGSKAEPWEEWQGAQILKLMDLTLAKNMKDEIARLSLASKGMKPTEIEEMMPQGERDKPFPLPELRRLYGYTESGKVKTRGTGEQSDAGNILFPIGDFASNNWVVSGERTTSGKPLLANDPHLGLTAPSLFYLVHLQYEEGGKTRNLIGASLPGVPLVLLGRNNDLAWGFTNTGLDSQDLFLEQINPENEDEYRTPEGWDRFKVEQSLIKVSGEEDHKLIIRKTRHGPVLPDDFENISEALPDGHVAALQWTALDNHDRSIHGLLGMVRSSSVSQFMNALKPVVSPMQSIVVGDKNGNIGLIAPGLVPVRKEENKVRGRAPVPGWKEEYDWKGVLDFSEVPRIENPLSGALATANSNWLPEDYPFMITMDWDEDFRQQRAEDLVVGRNQKHSFVTMRQTIGDIYSPALVKFREVALESMPNGTGPQLGMFDAIRSWDGKMEKDSPVPLIMASWFRHVYKLVFEDDLGETYRYFKKAKITPLLRVLEAQRSRPWCDNIETDAIENCRFIISQGLNAANDELIKLQGNDWRNWKWGKAHLAFNEHRPFSSVESLKKYFTIAPQSAGGSYTLRRGRWDFSKEKDHYFSRHGSVYRAVYDLSDLDKSLFIISSGQSGHFLSEHYDDMAEEWADVNFVEISSKIPKEIKRPGKSIAENIWELVPAQ